MQYDVCLSFAGEDRAYVERVAGALSERGVRVFYDGYEVATLWGRDLYSHLDEVYRRSARYCIIFVSRHYAEKLWTNHERISAQARAFIEAEAYVLPARFDDTEIPGLRPTIGYVDLRQTDPDELASIICEKLEFAPGDGGEVTSFGWFEPATVVTQAGSAQIPYYQGIPFGGDLAGLEDTVLDAFRGLQAQRHEESGAVFWTHGADRRFDRLYSTASVATALAQLGLPLDSEWMAGPMRYLIESCATDIDDRAATVFRLLTNALSEEESVGFVGALAMRQIKDPNSPFLGSFLLPQGAAGPLSSPKDVWSLSPLHSGGASFHACHVADILLHLPPDHTVARAAALPVLNGVREYLARTLRTNGGWLVDLEGIRTTQTLYALALCRSLRIPLVRNWPDVAVEALSLLREKNSGLAAKCFGAMNAAYLVRSSRSAIFEAAAVTYAKETIKSLEAGGAVSLLAPRDIALVLRAMLSALAVIEQSLVAVICRRAVAAAWRLGLA